MSRLLGVGLTRFHERYTVLKIQFTSVQEAGSDSYDCSKSESAKQVCRGTTVGQCISILLFFLN